MILDPHRAWQFFVEDEISARGVVGPVSTVFLTNRRCPWQCVMCDLWKNTLSETVPVGAIPAQIEHALAHLPAARDIKLYNSGSFFDPHAIPPEDYGAIAAMVQPFERTIVECHPALIGDECLRFRNMLPGRFEIAMGLETVDPEVLPKLNKGMTLDLFARAARFLRNNDIDLRVFILLQPPFMAAADAVYWAERSLDFAFDCGATAATVIPTRGGDTPPSPEMLEASVRYGLALKRGRVFSDLWDMPQSCVRERLRAMNLTQQAA